MDIFTLNNMQRTGLSDNYVSVVSKNDPPECGITIPGDSLPSYGGDQNWFHEIAVSAMYPEIERRDFGSVTRNGCTLIAATDFILYVLKYHAEITSEKIITDDIASMDLYTYAERVMLWKKKYFEVLFSGLDNIQMQNGFNSFFKDHGIKLICKASLFRLFDRAAVEKYLKNNIPVILSLRSNNPSGNRSLDFFTQEELLSGAAVSNKKCSINHTVNITGIIRDKNRIWLEISSWGRKYYIDCAEFRAKCIQFNSMLYFSYK